MRVHRSRHERGFTALPNAMLQDRSLSYTARGLLADLLSRHDGWREDAKRLADTSPQGRTAVSKALRELTRAGYYRVEKVRQSDGTFHSVAHVYDTPQPAAPGHHGPGSGGAAADAAGANPVKDREKEPSLPGLASPAPTRSGDAPGGEGGREASSDSTANDAVGQDTASQDTSAASLPTEADPFVREAVATLFRVLRPEPRLRVGAVEALELAPLVANWLEQGHGEQDLAQAVLPGLPARVHSPVALLRDRLVRKLPPPAQPAAVLPAPVPRWSECPTCADPVPHQGICRACAGLAPRTVAVGGGEAATARGIALARAAMRTSVTRLAISSA
ncbi:hypothetical protein E6W39_21840 [Kitasatospora acidiphila]|uniref:Helix-turn-helix domain-containing protein n=1 Tax=Kitasatospora acidiphila TaxID=2567942 RepID=A0A540W5S8_9ACTN|nr:hypothetical protein [Kitasatospora acidiphila]TQF04379.1 hypothetical protein E6W39_21840 [Kitasatospora acidiphila]